MDRFTGFRILVTGCTNGIGLETAKGLVRRGAHVIVHGRAIEKVEAAQREIGTEERTEGVVADLAALDAVERLADEIADGGGVDVLINNAGVGFGGDRHRRETSHDGLELRFAVNYLAPYVLTRSLVARPPQSGIRRAIVNVASIGQQELDFDDLQLESSYDGATAYCRSKLALIMMTFDLAAEFPQLGIVALHPGTFLDTGMVRETGRRPLGPASRGAETVQFAVDRALTGDTGQYFNELERTHPLPQANDPESRKALRERTEALLAGRR